MPLGVVHGLLVHTPRFSFTNIKPQMQAAKKQDFLHGMSPWLGSEEVAEANVEDTGTFLGTGF